MSARGWAYFLENEGHIDKSGLDWAQGKINDLRKSGELPLDFTAADDARGFKCVEHVQFADPTEYLRAYSNTVLQAHGYDVSFWDTQDVFIQVLVEKVDLRELFQPICAEYNIPIATAKGWSSMLQRGTLASRFYEWQQRGKQPVLLYCGDFDPAGVSIAETLRDNFRDLEDAKIPLQNPTDEHTYFTGWTPRSLTIDRFGLTHDQIENANLT